MRLRLQRSHGPDGAAARVSLPSAHLGEGLIMIFSSYRAMGIPSNVSAWPMSTAANHGVVPSSSSASPLQTVSLNAGAGAQQSQAGGKASSHRESPWSTGASANRALRVAASPARQELKHKYPKCPGCNHAWRDWEDAMRHLAGSRACVGACETCPRQE